MMNNACDCCVVAPINLDEVGQILTEPFQLITCDSDIAR